MPGSVDTVPLLALIGAMVLIAGPRVKTLIDMIGMGVMLPRWAPPALAFALGNLTCVLFIVAMAIPLSPPLFAVCVFAGITVAGDAVAITELQNRRGEAVRAARRAEREP